VKDPKRDWANWRAKADKRIKKPRQNVGAKRLAARPPIELP